MPSPTGKDPAAHMLFVRDAFPEVYERTYKFLNVLDYLNLRLTGRFVATPTRSSPRGSPTTATPTASTTTSGLVRDCGIDADKLPEIVPCTEVLGPLTAEAAAALGLPRSTPVVAGAIDNTAAAVGSGAVDDFAPHLYVGTSSWLAAHVPYKKTDIFTRHRLGALRRARALVAHGAAVDGRRQTHVPARQHPLPPGRAARRGAPCPTSSRSSTAWRRACRRAATASSTRPGSAASAPRSTTARCAPACYNLSLDTTREDIVRAFLEGVALNTRWLLKPVERFLGRPVRPSTWWAAAASRTCGARSSPTCSGVAIRQVRDPIQANARGAAWIAAVAWARSISRRARGWWASRGLRAAGRGRAVYDESFAAFLEIHKRLRPLPAAQSAAPPVVPVAPAPPVEAARAAGPAGDASSPSL